MVTLIGLLLACSTATAPPPEATAEAPARKAQAPLPRGWLERVVGTDDPDTELPMVVMVHGLGDRPESMLGLLDDDLPGPTRIIAPRAPDSYGQGFSWFSERASGDRLALERQMKKTAADFVRNLSRVHGSRPTTGKPILSGFSQGGMLSFTVATHHPDAIDKAVPVAGWLPEGLWPEGEPPEGAPAIVALHGTADPVLPLAPTQAAVEALTERGWTVELKTFEGVQHKIPSEVREALLAELAP